MIKFHAPNPWIEIKKWAPKQKSLVAVPFLGKNAANLLPITAGSILVTRFNDETIKSGLVSPIEIIKFLKRGIKVHSDSKLHAKVYVFGKRAFVGSANVSNSSQSSSEACIETNDIQVVQQAREYIASLTSNLVTLEEAKSKLALYPKDGERLFGVKAIKGIQRRVWIVPLGKNDFTDEQMDAMNRGIPIAKKKSLDTSKFKLDGFINDDDRLMVGDWIIQRFNYKSGFLFECPAKIIYIEPVEGSKENFFFLDKPKRIRDISSTVVKQKMGGKSSIAIYKSSSNRLIKSDKTAQELLWLWKHHQGNT